MWCGERSWLDPRPSQDRRSENPTGLPRARAGRRGESGLPVLGPVRLGVRRVPVPVVLVAGTEPLRKAFLQPGKRVGPVQVLAVLPALRMQHAADVRERSVQYEQAGELTARAARSRCR